MRGRPPPSRGLSCLRGNEGVCGCAVPHTASTRSALGRALGGRSGRAEGFASRATVSAPPPRRCSASPSPERARPLWPTPLARKLKRAGVVVVHQDLVKTGFGHLAGRRSRTSTATLPSSFSLTSVQTWLRSRGGKKCRARWASLA